MGTRFLTPMEITYYVIHVLKTYGYYSSVWLIYVVTSLILRNSSMLNPQLSNFTEKYIIFSPETAHVICRAQFELVSIF